VSTRHPDAILARMADHVGFELRMVGRLMHEATAAPEEPGEHAVLESYLLHVRTLSSFLGTTSERAWPDDVVADDYFRGPHERFAPLTSDDRRDIDQRLSHLTTDRLADAGTLEGLDRAYWGRRVIREFGRFVDALRVESSVRADWFEAALTDTRRNARPSPSR
jgi:hypothetical protein